MGALNRGLKDEDKHPRVSRRPGRRRRLRAGAGREPLHSGRARQPGRRRPRGKTAPAHESHLHREMHGLDERELHHLRDRELLGRGPRLRHQ